MSCVSSVVLHVEADTSLVELNGLIARNEGQFGSLAAIGNDGRKTLLTFDGARPSPSRRTVLRCCGPQWTQPRADASIVCRGHIFVAAALTASVAFRQPEPPGGSRGGAQGATVPPHVVAQGDSSLPDEDAAEN